MAERFATHGGGNAGGIEKRADLVCVQVATCHEHALRLFHDAPQELKRFDGIGTGALLNFLYLPKIVPVK